MKGHETVQSLRDDLAVVEQQIAKYTEAPVTVRLMWERRRAVLKEEIANQGLENNGR